MAARHPPCRALKPKEKDYKVTDRDGMYVHVTAKGAMVRQLGLADRRLGQISLAVRRIRDRHAEMLRIEDLARKGRQTDKPLRAECAKSRRRTKRHQRDLKPTKINQTFCFYEPPYRERPGAGPRGKQAH